MDSDDEYIVQYFSDEGGIDSSDDDEQVMKEFAIQASKIRRGDSAKKLVEEFESDMRDEIEQRASKLQEDGHFRVPGSTKVMADQSISGLGLESDDSGSDQEDLIPASNTDLFYDPEMDDKDEIWVHSQRNKFNFRSSGAKMKPLPNSDAVLNCPACFTSLSRDCQRHAVHKSQYRAMFTFNCNIDKSMLMRFPAKAKKSQKPKKTNKFKKFLDRKAKEAALAIEGAQSEAASMDGAPCDAPCEELEAPAIEDDEVYHPVRCSTCDTQVAVYDKDEVFHFFNVVTSH